MPEDNVISLHQPKIISVLLIIPSDKLVISNLIVQCPPNIFQIGIIQEILREFLHPQPNFTHTNGTNFW